MAGHVKTEKELWADLSGLDDDLLNPDVPDAHVDAALVDAGVDPAALAERGNAFVTLQKEEKRLAWQTTALERKVELEARAARARGDVQAWDRGAILARMDQLRAADPNLGTAIAMAARKRKPEESSDEELRALLEQMEALRAIEGGD